MADIDWKTLGKSVASSAPLLGTLLGGPAAGAVGAIIASVFGVGNTPGDIVAALNSPDAAVKLRQIEKDREVELQALLVAHAEHELAAETAQLQAVNATMQAETKAEHWWSSGWRPFNGFIFGITFAGVYFVLPLAKIPVPVIPMEAWASMGAILGVASWFRGKAQADPLNKLPANRG